MPRVQIYLPDDLHQAVKELELPISELSQHAARMELRRRALTAEAEWPPRSCSKVGRPAGPRMRERFALG